MLKVYLYRCTGITMKCTYFNVSYVLLLIGRLRYRCARNISYMGATWSDLTRYQSVPKISVYKGSIITEITQKNVYAYKDSCSRTGLQQIWCVVTFKGCGNNRPCRNLRHYSGIRLKKLWITTESLMRVVGLRTDI